MTSDSLTKETATHDGVDALQLTGDFRGETFTVAMTDRDVAAVMERFDRPADGVTTLLRVGASACHAASAGLDLHAVRQEMDGAVRGACDAVADLRDHIAEVAGSDGPMAEAIRSASAALIEQLQEAVAAQADADSPGTLLARVQTAARSFEDGLATTRKEISDDLAGAVEKHSEAVRSAIREMKDLDPNSAIGGAFNRVEGHLKDLGEKIVAAQSATGERLKSAAKGLDFEQDVAASVAGIAAVYGDRAERTGDHGGKVIQTTRPSKRGDVTCFVGDAPSIVIEAMDRGSDQLKSKLVNNELAEAMANRGAMTAIAVVSTADNSLMCGQPIQVLGPRCWAVVYDRAERAPLALQVAYRLAREVATAPSPQEEALDLELVRKGIEDVNRCISMLSDVRAQLANIRSSHDRASDALGKYERQVQDATRRLLATMVTQSVADAA